MFKQSWTLQPYLTDTTCINSISVPTSVLNIPDITTILRRYCVYGT